MAPPMHRPKDGSDPAAGRLPGEKTWAAFAVKASKGDWSDTMKTNFHRIRAELRMNYVYRMDRNRWTPFERSLFPWRRFLRKPWRTTLSSALFTTRTSSADFSAAIIAQAEGCVCQMNRKENLTLWRSISGKPWRIMPRFATFVTTGPTTEKTSFKYFRKLP